MEVQTVSSNCCPGFVYANFCSKNTVEFPLVMTSWQTKHEFIFAGAVSVKLLGAYSHQDLLVRCGVLAVFGIIWTFFAELVWVDPIHCQWRSWFCIFCTFSHCRMTAILLELSQNGAWFSLLIWGWGAANKNRKLCELLSVDIHNVENERRQNVFK